MKVRLLDVAAPQWNEFLSETRHDFYHLPAYAALCADRDQGEARALLVDDGARGLLLPLVLRAIPGTDRRDAMSPYGYPGPLMRGTGDPAFMSEAMAAGTDGLRSEGLVSAFVRLHPLLNPSPPEGIGEVVLHGETVSVDLTLPNATRWAQMRHNHQQDIKKAVRSGLAARMDLDFEQYGAFERIYRATMDRLSAAPRYQFGDEYFDRLRAALGERLSLCVVEQDGTVAAAGLFVETNGIVQYHLGGTDEAFVRSEPSKLMVHFACDWARERGNRLLHLGGGVGGRPDSLFHYKAGFSPVRHPFRTLRAVIDAAEYRRLVSARDPSLDPGVPRGFFPAYRTS
jgi:hypothetical protein